MNASSFSLIPSVRGPSPFGIIPAMRKLTRYVLREFLVPLFYCLTGFLSIYVLFDLFGSFSRMYEAKLPVSVAVEYFCGYLAPYFHYMAPAALMLATLYTMWVFCRHSEIVAMRASGVSFVTIVKPLLAVALLMGLFVAWVNESYVPRRAQWAAQMKTVHFDLGKIGGIGNVVLRNAKDCRTWNIDAMLDRDGRALKGVRVSVDRPNGGARLMNIVADRADYLDGEWWFTGCRVQHFDAAGLEVPTTTPELDALDFRCFGLFTERPEDFIAQNRKWQYCSVRDRLRYLRSHPDLEREKRNECVYDIWAQIMAPWACLVITLFAIPAGIASGRQSVFRGILGALGMYFSFYGLTIGLMIAAKNGLCPPIPAAMLPCLTFLALGVRSFFKQR